MIWSNLTLRIQSCFFWIFFPGWKFNVWGNHLGMKSDDTRQRVSYDELGRYIKQWHLRGAVLKDFSTVLVKADGRKRNGAVAFFHKAVCTSYKFEKVFWLIEKYQSKIVKKLHTVLFFDRLQIKIFVKNISMVANGIQNRKKKKKLQKFQKHTEWTAFIIGERQNHWWIWANQTGEFGVPKKHPLFLYCVGFKRSTWNTRIFLAWP